MKKTICDDIAARELFLYAVNKEALYSDIRSVLKCLYRKAMKGQYIIDKASDAFAGVVKSAAIMMHLTQLLVKRFAASWKIIFMRTS